MAGKNEREMLRMTEFVRKGCVSLAVLGMRTIHRGTVRRFGASPGTPVDTGEARSGGRVGLGSPPTFVPPPEAPAYPIMGDDEIDATFARAQLGDSFFWGNLVPYIGLLEDGRSKQAPDGFMTQSIAEAKKVVEGKEVKRRGRQRDSAGGFT